MSTPAPTLTLQQSRAWHVDSVEQVLQSFDLQIEEGLSEADAKRLLAQYGPNELRENPPTPFWKLVVDQFNNFIVILLIVASALSLLLGDVIEAAAIMAIVVLNAAFGIVQESRAEQSLAALKKLAAPDALVLRGGHRLTVPSRELVPGDLVLLEAGNFIPADLRLVESVNLRIDEAALTGESVPVEKDSDLTLAADIGLGDRRNAAFMSTIATFGRGMGVVTGTGMQTEIGRIAELLQEVEEEETPLQKRLDRLGRTLGYASLLIVGLVFVLGVLRGVDALEMFIIAVSLAIAAVPEGLPAVVTISLALGMREMIQHNALIRKLASVETLGSASIICSDKTGTLTQNEMTTVRIWIDGTDLTVTGDGYDPHGEIRRSSDEADVATEPAVQTALRVALLANDAVLEEDDSEDSRWGYRMVGDPTEGALVVAAAKAGLWREAVEAEYPRVAENPFDSARKMMSTLHVAQAGEQSVFAFVKGAPDLVLNHCSHIERNDGSTDVIDAVGREQILAANTEMSEDALRVLAVAYRKLSALPDEVSPESIENELTFVGLLGMIDPARPEVSAAIATARRAGIRTVMITGDHPETAEAIAKDLGLLRRGGRVVRGAVLNDLSDEELAQVIEKTDVFARVSPHHKVRLVEAYQRSGAVVAMTGDGVNDAPAVKRADIGVSMGITGTDVAKEASDMVLTDDNYASIVAAVEQGRVIYANIRKFVFFLLSSNVAEIMIIFLATLAGLPAPLAAIQLLWLNLVTDGAPALALAVEPGNPDTMELPPRPKEEPIVNRSMRLGIIVQTITQTAVTLSAYAIGLLALVPAGTNPIRTLLSTDWLAYDIDVPLTMAFITISLCELFRANTVRSERYSIFRIGFFSNKFMLPAIATSVILLLLVVNIPFLQPIFHTAVLTINQWLLIVGLALVPAVSEEITKMLIRRAT